MQLCSTILYTLTGSHQRLALVDSFTVRAGDTVLSRVYQFKYLGITLDPYLSWNDYIDYIGRKISAKLGMLRNVRKVIPSESCLTLCNAMILLVFDYCAVVWDSCNKADRQYLEKLQGRARQYYCKLHSRTIADILHFRLAYIPVPLGLSKVLASV